MNQKQKPTGETPTDLRRAAHNWRQTQKNLIAAQGTTAVAASEEHRRASRKLAAVVDYDMRTGRAEP